MRTPLLVGVVVAVHCVAVGSAVLIQGCRTSYAPKVEPAVKTETAEIKKPESVPQAVPQPVPAVVPPVIETPKVEQAPASETTTYVVASGDSLSVIAYKYGLKVPEIMALNTMTNPGKLRIGQKLLLPGKINIASPKRHHVAKKPKVEEAKSAENAGGNAGGEEYKVEPGDSLSAIAVKYGTTVGAIKKANGLTSGGLKAGQKIMIPGAAKKGKTTESSTEKTEAPGATVTTTEPAAGTPAPAPAVAPVDAAAPAPATVPAVQPAAGAPAAGKTAAPQTYTVEPNDDLVKVSKMWGVSVEELKKLNGLSDTALKPGQVLKIPPIVE